MSWRTNPYLVKDDPQLLAQKMIEAGWKTLTRTEKRHVRTLFPEVLVHLDAMQRDELAARLSLAIPEGLAPPLPPRPFGKQALLAKLRAKFDEARREAH
jgi:hypothetical protein